MLVLFLFSTEKIRISVQDCDDNPETGKLVHSNCTKEAWVLDKDDDKYYVEGSEKQEYHNWNQSDKFVEGYKKKEDRKEGDCKDDDKKYKFSSLTVSLSVQNSSQVGTGADFESGNSDNFQAIHDVISSSELNGLQKINAHYDTYWDSFYDQFMTEEDYIDNLRDFAEWTTFNDELVNEMIDRFTLGDSSTHFTSSNLTQSMLGSSGFQSFKSGLTSLIAGKLLNVTEESSSILIEDLGGPTFNENGGLFSWNGSHSSNLEVSSLTINCKTFTMSGTLTMYDHFGLDNTDLYSQPISLSGVDEFIARRSRAMRGWFILQKIKGYKPFVSEVSTSINISNESF
jgi:hypothetical protein